jgi:leucyl aminopeptidase
MRAIVGDDLLKENFPLVYAVGKASTRAPRLIDLRWGDAKNPKVALVGKGVVFDTGGLDIKPSAGMLLMKKDMGGAASALGLASMIMSAKLPLYLRVIIPAVENAISGEAFRPGDVFKSRKGTTVEIGNTDAEGRLILADALALADEEAPDLIVDFSTLTGAARVALGPELPAAFTDDEKLAAALSSVAAREADPFWRLPLWRPYQSMLDSKIADTNNVSSSAFAGAITAALFLSRFVERAKSWLHFDLYAWNSSSKPGRPEGGEAQTIRALFTFLQERYR